MEDHLAKMYADVRDATLNNEMVDSDSKIAVLEIVKAEIVGKKLQAIRDEAMDA